MEEDARTLLHAVAVLRFYANQLERGWRHQALEHNLCLHAAARLLEIDLDDPARADRVLLRKVADLLACVEPNAYEPVARRLRQIAGQPELLPPDNR